ncbi:MAG: hypothetical protein PVF26_04370 [Desulfobacterales bacterium]|jgi:hypothetical protein
MPSQINKVHCIHKFILFALIFSLTLPFFYSCGEKKESAKNQTAQVPSESFTFFDLGRQSTLSRSVRDDLKRRLGRDAIEHRSIIDLDINFYGFLKKYFPSLYALNQNLNFPPGERIEHNTVKLMYRYARKENIPFDYVELVFSNYSQHPLLFRINFQKDEADIIETLKTKYGEPLLIDWKDKSGQSMYWEKNNDLLIVSLVPDQFGNPEYQIRIFFVENIRTLLAAERAEKEKAERQRAKSGKTAF